EDRSTGASMRSRRRPPPRPTARPAVPAARCTARAARRPAAYAWARCTRSDVRLDVRLDVRRARWRWPPWPWRSGAPPAAGEPHRPLLAPRRLTALRTSGPVRIDGVLDEATWAAAPVAEQFVQEGPAPGEPSRLRTSFRVMFDDAALYVGVRLDDPAAWAI